MHDESIGYHYERILSEVDSKQYLCYTFEVPAGCTQLGVRMHYEPAGVGGIHNVLSLSLFDPAGFRGAGHCRGTDQDISLAAAQATPGFLAGPLVPGTWTVEVETHAVLPGEPCRLDLDIVATCAPGAAEHDAGDAVASLDEAAADAVIGRPGWYRGDLHTHTIHSDGHIDVAGRVREAQAQGLDFFVLTDHNTISGLIEMARMATPGFLKLGGMELTTFWGHALLLGTRRWIDWRVRPGDGQMPAIARTAGAAGQLFVIAHPCSQDDPVCTGCGWHFDDAMPGPALVVEVWNGPWDGDSGNEGNLALWYAWLNQGHHLMASAGTDSHEQYGDVHGQGFDIVYADALSEEAVLDAIRRGHLYLSDGPRLSLTAHADGQSPDVPAMMGDTVAGEAVSVTCEWENCPPDTQVRVMVDGLLRQAWPASVAGRQSWVLRAGEDHWCVVEARDRAGRMAALTNPIFLAGH